MSVRPRLRLDRHDAPTPADDASAVALVDALTAKLNTSRTDLEQWDRYYRGTQPLSFLHPEVALTVGERLKSMVVNWPRLVLDALEERLDITGFRLPGQDAADQGIWRLWQANNFDLASGRCHLAALRHGRAFVTVWSSPDPQLPRLAVETARQMTVDYYPGTCAVRYALKRWTDGSLEYANLYLPDRITKYVRGGEIAKTPGAREVGGWVIRGELDNPLGVVPVVPFLNRYDLDMPDGESELTDVVHLADAINKLATDMMVASEFHAMPRRWATGIEVSAGPEAKRVEEKARKYWDEAIAGRTWLAGKEVTLGQFASADLSNFTNAINLLTAKAAALAGLPPHYVGITADNPASADAIRSAEAALVKRAERKQRTFGESWEAVIRLALQVRDGSLDPAYAEMETVWRDPQTPTVAQRADAASKLHTAGIIDVEQAQEDIGYSPQQRQQMADRRRKALALQATADMRARVEQALALINEHGIEEKVAFASVGLITAPKGTSAGPEAPAPPDGDPLDTTADTAAG
ncbi:MAG TPA: phage portal protein [Mycobacteriales bacterium]|nr:phage portal protein [Mycobacteriales bacterium]